MMKVIVDGKEYKASGTLELTSVDEPVEPPTEPPVEPPEQGEGFRDEWDLRSEESIDSVRYKNPPADPMITFDPDMGCAVVKFDQRIGCGSGDQLHYMARRDFGPTEGDTRISWGFSVCYSDEWLVPPAGIRQHKLVRLDNNKTANGESIRPVDDRNFEFNPNYFLAVTNSIGLPGTRFYNFEEAGYTDTTQQGVTGDIRYQPNNPSDVYYMVPERWYDVEYVWAPNPEDNDRWWLTMFVNETLVMTRPAEDEKKMVARKMRCPEVATSQDRADTWNPTMGQHPIWFRDFFVEVTA